MTLPRPVRPGATIAITRRCVFRQFLLKPTRRVNLALRYGLAEAANEFGVEVHAFVAMSNHVHIVCTDPDGVYPLFLERFFKLTAKCLNCLYGRWGPVWDAEQASVIHIIDDRAALGWVLYSLCNPVKANLVDRVGHWPGVTSWHATVNDKLLGATRPTWFFNPSGTMPTEAWIAITPPPMFEGSSDEWRALVKRKVADREATLARARKGRVLGRKAVLAQSRHDSSVSPEPHRELQRRVAGGRKWPRI